jgi:hypothetical protein
MPYDAGWTFVSHHLSECMVFRATGHMSYTLWYGTIGHAAEYFWTNQSLNDPTLNLKVYDYSSKFRDCAGRAYLIETTIAQHWSGYSCSFNPSITISGPWGVGVSGWPDCGNREQAHYAEPYHGKNWTFTQYNSGSKSRFGNYSHLDTFAPPCYGVFVSGDFKKAANVSDSFGEGNAGADSHKVCLSKK